MRLPGFHAPGWLPGVVVPLYPMRGVFFGWYADYVIRRRRQHIGAHTVCGVHFVCQWRGHRVRLLRCIFPSRSRQLCGCCLHYKCLVWRMLNCGRDIYGWCSCWRCCCLRHRLDVGWADSGFRNNLRCACWYRASSFDRFVMRRVDIVFMCHDRCSHGRRPSATLGLGQPLLPTQLTGIVGGTRSRR